MKNIDLYTDWLLSEHYDSVSLSPRLFDINCRSSPPIFLTFRPHCEVPAEILPWLRIVHTGMNCIKRFAILQIQIRTRTIGIQDKCPLVLSICNRIIEMNSAGDADSVAQFKAGQSSSSIQQNGMQTVIAIRLRSVKSERKYNHTHTGSSIMGTPTC